jgi:serine/threonine-protein kinase
MPTYAFEGFALDIERGSLRHERREISLRPQSFAVLCYLVKNGGRLVAKAELKEAIWGSTAVTEDSLVQCLGDVRRALGDRDTLVRTIPRRGYMLDTDVACLPSSVAVLPLVDLEADAGQQYLGDGLAEELITQLARVRGLRVASRSSSFRFRGSEQDLQSIGKALNVDSVIEGSIRRAGDRFRVSVRLVDVNDGLQIWSESYDGPAGDIFAVQDELARAISAKLHGESGDAPAARRRPGNIEAYDLYLTGRFFWNKRTGPGLLKAIECWQRALQKDARYALAHAGVADGYTLLAYFGYLAPEDAFARVEAAASTALEIDGDLAEAHVSLANLKLHYHWAFEEASREIHRAIALDPGYYHAYHVLSHCCVAMGDLDGSLAASLRALDLDPLDLVLVAHMGWHCLHSGEHERGVHACKRALDMEPGFVAAHIYLGQLLTALRRYDEAVAAFRRSEALSGGSTDVRGHLGLVHALAGRRREALRVLDQLRREARRRYVSAYHLGAIHLALGNLDEGLACLQRAVSERTRFIAYVKVDPVLPRLMGERRFSRFVRQVIGGAQRPRKASTSGARRRS